MAYYLDANGAPQTHLEYQHTTLVVYCFVVVSVLCRPALLPQSTRCHNGSWASGTVCGRNAASESAALHMAVASAQRTDSVYFTGRRLCTSAYRRSARATRPHTVMAPPIGSRCTFSLPADT